MAPLPSIAPAPAPPAAPYPAALHPLTRLHLLCFPPACHGCGRLMNPLARAEAGFPYLCAPCWEALPWKSPRHSCRACGALTAEPERERCPVCSERKHHVTRVWCACSYHDPVAGWVRALKYQRQEGLALLLGTLLALAPNAAGALEGGGLVVPVPLHPGRVRRRGFNQSYLLAHQWLRRWRRAGTAAAPPRPEVLVRHRPTAPQVDLSAEERFANVAAAFSVPDRTLVAGRRVLLVDDLMTTGATLNACALALREAGAARVDALVLARA